MFSHRTMRLNAWLLVAATCPPWGTSPLLADDLPSEATLPGQVALAVRELPPESALPAGSTPAVITVSRRIAPVPVENSELDLPPGYLPVTPVVRAGGQEPLPKAPDVTLSPAPVTPTGAAASPPVVTTAPPVVAEVPVAQLAAESELPEALKQGLAQQPGKLRVDITPGGDIVLPDENDVPSDTLAQLPLEPDVIPIGRQPAGQPWLRLNMSGHSATARALVFTRDSQRLCSAGDDKSLEVWSEFTPENAAPRWLHERSVRWQIHRGARGRIHALAAGEGLIAMAGHGAMGLLGEILLIDPMTGNLRRVLADAEKGHSQSVLSLSLSPRATQLASQDITGRAVLWRPDAQSGIWQPVELAQRDSVRYSEDTARRLIPQRRAAPIVLLGERFAVLPKFHEFQTSARRPDGVPTWQLERIELATMRSEILPGVIHGGMVTALAASSDGSRMASADTFGKLYIWSMKSTPQATEIPLDFAALSLSLSDNGQVLAVGGGASPKRQGQAAVQLWDLRNPAQPRRISELGVPSSVFSVALSSNGRTLAYSQDNEVQVKSSSALEAPGQALEGRARPVLRVAFSKSDPPYRIAFGTQRGSDGRVILNRSFDLAQVRLESRSQLNDADWLSLVTPPADWNLRTIPTSYGETYWLFRGQKQVAQLPLRPELHGRPSATCWIADAQGQPFAVAVGTALQGNIYVFRLEAADEARLMRQFRGHEGGVRSISMSQDRRYLVSASDDATIRVWNLAGFETESDLTNRWGGELQVQNGELAVVSLREDGPFYFRGFRVGDVIDALLWMDSRDGKTKQSTDPEVMLNVLRTAGPDAQIVFEYRRREMAQPVMQLLPAWQQLAALFVAENREWAFWTPAGFYDASFEGHKLFGWQVNRGLQLLPEFFLAAQFQQALERPQVMAHLLNAGSLEAAFRAAQQPPPANAQNAVGDQYRLKPRVEIIAPQPDALVSGATPVEARITVRDGLQLTPPKAFANGVVAPRRRLVDVQATEGGFTYHYAWDAQLPSNARVVIQVVASTDAAVVDTQSVVVRQDVGSRRPARLYVVAAGVNQYRDAQIQRLDFATSNARSLIDTLQSRARGLYESEATMLVDDQVTRPMWTVVSRAYAERLRTEAGPDDLLVFFLSGHGVRDEETSRYYFVAANARYDDVKSQRFGDCLAFEDFAAFADVPCRKLVVLDTCHSGAVQQPLRQQDLKAALRALQTDVVFTLTASEGSQEAAEERGRRLGRFTSRLLEALSGAADQKVAGGNGDQVVTLQETYQYVSSALAADSVDSATIQHPTVGPIDLLDFAVLPLAAGG